MSSELEKRVQQLEEKFEYQDRLVETLNQVVIEQQAQLDTFKDKVEKLREDIGAANTQRKEMIEPPPIP